MKVPTYQTQGNKTASGGSIQMSVQASPGALSQGYDAQYNLAMTAQSESLKWYETELKAERASKLAAAENQLTQTLQDQQLKAADLSKTDPAKALKNYNAVIKSTKSSLANKIDDEIVKKRFLSSATTDISNKRISILQTVRNGQIDIGKANIIQQVSSLEQTIATGNNAERSKAKLKLFGVEVAPGKFAGGIYQRAANIGYFSQTEAANSTIKSRGKVDRLSVRQQLSNAAISADPDQALVVLQNLSNPKNYTNLNPVDRDNLIREANSLVGTLERRRISDDARIDKKNTKIKKDRQENNFNTFLGNILDSSVPGSKTTMPSSSQILASFRNADIDDKQLKILDTLVKGQDARVSDASVVVKFHERLANAKNNNEINDIIGEVKSQIGLNGSVILGDAVGIIKTAKGYLNSSQESTDVKRYATILKTAIGDTPGGFTMSGVKNQSSIGLRRADAMYTYYALVGEGKDPIEVYKEVAQQYSSNLSEEMGFIAPSTAMMKAVGKADITKWTPKDVANARSLILANPINRTTNKRTFTPLELVLEKETINLVESYQIEKDNFSKLLPKPNNDPEVQKGGVNWWDSVTSVFESSDEDKIKNPR